MVQDTEVIYAVAGSSATVRSSIYRLRPIHERTHEAVQVSITAGTATVNIEGRTSQNEPWVVIATLSASDIVMVPAGIELSANVTAAAVATIRVTTARPAVFVA